MGWHCALTGMSDKTNRVIQTRVAQLKHGRASALTTLGPSRACGSFQHRSTLRQGQAMRKQRRYEGEVNDGKALARDASR